MKGNMMCRSNADGGKRCDGENAKRKTLTEQKIQNKVLETMHPEDREHLEFTINNYEKLVAMAGSDTVSIDEGYEDAVEAKLFRNHEWNTAQEKYHDAANDYETYELAVQGMEYPDTYDKEVYLKQTNSDFAKIHAQYEGLADKNYTGGLSDSDQAKMDSLKMKKHEIISGTQPLPKAEIDKLIKNNPHRSSFKKADKKYQETNTRLKNHYRREQVFNDNEYYQETYDKFSKTNAGKKLTRELAEIETHESISKRALDGGSIKVNVYRKRGNEVEAKNAEKNLAVRHQVSNAYEYNNKYSHINQQITNGSKNIDKNMELPMGAKDSMVQVQTNEQFAKTMTRAESAYGAKYADDTPEVRRSKVANELFARRKVTSVREIASNPELKKFFDGADEKHREFRNKVVDRQARIVANRYEE